MHTFVKKITFKPLAGGMYRCIQTGKVMSQKQIPSYVSEFLSGISSRGNGAILRISGAKPNERQRNTSPTTHVSKCRNKKKRR